MHNVKPVRSIVKRLAIALVSVVAAVTAVTAATAASSAMPTGSTNGFNEYGYNYSAHVFVGTCASWADSKGIDGASYCGAYANDQLVMKWNAAWDACNANGYDDATYCAGAWLTNEWNGKVPGGSGDTEHFKAIWVGSDGADSPYWQPGGEVIWNNYEVVMDQGISGGTHEWWTHATPNGFGIAN